MTPDTAEDGGRQVVGEGKWRGKAGRSLVGGEVCVRGILEQGWKRSGWDEADVEAKGRRGEGGGGQQPVLDDHSTHYSTDAAADPVEKEEPLSLSRIAAAVVVVAGPTLLRVLTPLLPAISTSQGRIRAGNSSFVTFDKPREITLLKILLIEH